MADKKTYGTRPDAPEIESIESILDSLDKEMTATATVAENNDPPNNEMDLMVADLLEHLQIEN